VQGDDVGRTVDALPALGVLVEHEAARLLGARLLDDLVLDVARLELIHRQRLAQPFDVRDGDRLRVRELILDLLVDDDADPERGEEQQDRQQPRPDRSAPRRLLVVVVDRRLLGGPHLRRRP
jgi:hypothetical protein